MSNSIGTRVLLPISTQQPLLENTTIQQEEASVKSKIVSTSDSDFTTCNTPLQSRKTRVVSTINFIALAVYSPIEKLGEKGSEKLEKIYSYVNEVNEQLQKLIGTVLIEGITTNEEESVNNYILDLQNCKDEIYTTLREYGFYSGKQEIDVTMDLLLSYLAVVNSHLYNLYSIMELEDNIQIVVAEAVKITPEKALVIYIASRFKSLYNPTTIDYQKNIASLDQSKTFHKKPLLSMLKDTCGFMFDMIPTDIEKLKIFKTTIYKIIRTADEGYLPGQNNINVIVKKYMSYKDHVIYKAINDILVTKQGRLLFNDIFAIVIKYYRNKTASKKKEIVACLQECLLTKYKIKIADIQVFKDWIYSFIDQSNCLFFFITYKPIRNIIILFRQYESSPGEFYSDREFKSKVYNFINDLKDPAKIKKINLDDIPEVMLDIFHSRLLQMAIGSSFGISQIKSFDYAMLAIEMLQKIGEDFTQSVIARSLILRDNYDELANYMAELEEDLKKALKISKEIEPTDDDIKKIKLYKLLIPQGYFHCIQKNKKLSIEKKQQLANKIKQYFEEYATEENDHPTYLRLLQLGQFLAKEKSTTDIEAINIYEDVVNFCEKHMEGNSEVLVEITQNIENCKIEAECLKEIARHDTDDIDDILQYIESPSVNTKPNTKPTANRSHEEQSTSSLNVALDNHETTEDIPSTLITVNSESANSKKRKKRNAKKQATNDASKETQKHLSLAVVAKTQQSDLNSIEDGKKKKSNSRKKSRNPNAQQANPVTYLGATCATAQSNSSNQNISNQRRYFSNKIVEVLKIQGFNYKTQDVYYILYDILQSSYYKHLQESIPDDFNLAKITQQCMYFHFRQLSEAQERYYPADLPPEYMLFSSGKRGAITSHSQDCFNEVITILWQFFVVFIPELADKKPSKDSDEILKILLNINTENYKNKSIIEQSTHASIFSTLGHLNSRTALGYLYSKKNKLLSAKFYYIANQINPLRLSSKYYKIKKERVQGKIAV